MKTENGSFKRLLNLIKPYWFWITAITVLLVAASLITVYTAFLSKRVLDIACKDVAGSFTAAVFALLLFVLLRVLLSCAGSYIKSVTEAKMNTGIRQKLFNALLAKKYTAVSAYHSGELLNRFGVDVAAVSSGAVSLIPGTVSLFAKLIAGTVALFTVDPFIAAAIVILGFFVPAFGRIFKAKFKNIHKLFRSSEGEVKAFFQESVQNLTVVKTFKDLAAVKNRLENKLNNSKLLFLRRAKIGVATSAGLGIFFAMCYYAVLVWGAFKIGEGSITFGTLIALLELVEQIRNPLQSLSGILPEYYSVSASAERIFELEDLPNENLTAADLPVFESLSANELCFAYKTENVINNARFTVNAGQIAAVSGLSGAGKTTLFKIILGLLEPQKGNVLINDSFPADSSTRKYFAYVPQGSLILSGTIKENLLLGNPAATDAEITEALKVAEIFNTVNELPHGINTPLSERGAGLSEGQLQRLAIARAVLSGAPVLLLDESTSALDEPTESLVLNNIKAQNKTVLFITHRKRNLSLCDLVITVESGEIN